MGTPEHADFLFREEQSSPLGRVAWAGFLRGYNALPEHWTHGSGAYGLVYVLQGKCNYADDTGARREVQAGDLLLLSPGSIHQNGFNGVNRADFFYVVFEGPVFDLWRERRLLSPLRPALHLEPVSHWLIRFKAFFEEVKRSDDHAALERVCRLQQLLAEVLAHGAPDHRSDHDQQWLRQASALVCASSPELEWHQVALQLGMSYETFRKRFTRLSGVPPARFRAEAVIRRACGLMYQFHRGIKEIAHDCGFENEFHFSRRFKQVTGLPPSTFRKALQQVPNEAIPCSRGVVIL